MLIAEEVSTLFRGTSLTTTLMDQYMKMVAIPYLQKTIGDVVAKILECKQSCEVWCLDAFGTNNFRNYYSQKKFRYMVLLCQVKTCDAERCNVQYVMNVGQRKNLRKNLQ